MVSQINFEKELLYYLVKIVYEGGSSNILIITQGPVYIQFIAERGCNELILEAISNQFLPSNRNLNQAAYNELQELGFDIPSGEGGNFQRICDVSHPEYFHQLAHFACSLLTNIFGCDISSNFNFELELE